MEGDTVCSVKPDNRAQHPSKRGRIEMNSSRRCMFERQPRRCVRGDCREGAHEGLNAALGTSITVHPHL